MTVMDLPLSHPLHGQKGLFAAVDLQIFDVIGMYTGIYVNSDARGFPSHKLVKSGHYLARLEDVDMELGINAEECGNEMRFINSYLNIAERPNCVMRTTFVNSLPQIAVVCTTDIPKNSEILLDYGEAYNARYILPKRFDSVCMDTKDLWNELPFLDDDHAEEI